MNRSVRAVTAKETLEILERGSYLSPSGRVVRIDSDVRAALDGTRLYRPADFPEGIEGCGPVPERGGVEVEVTPETSLQAARRLALGASRPDVLCLNFASAKNPGGGFLSGSQAQEESLARSSALYASLTSRPEMYEFNRRVGTCLYSDHMIYSPRVPVFRDDEGRLLEEPYRVSFITAPAVNAGAVRRNERNDAGAILPTMRRRLGRVLWVAALQGHTALVLGAWGCGVFRNEPAEVARLFAEALGPGGPFRECFRQIVYAVYDKSPGEEVLSAFRGALAEGAEG
ncbi:MAG: TIGR02452 family protein [Acidobacteria bacterium]|nr:TIGR02452 family protein [Acidobacteriota bacterium]